MKLQAALLALMLTGTITHIQAAESATELNEIQIAHVANTSDNINIRYALLALAISTNPAIREFAETMIRDNVIKIRDK